MRQVATGTLRLIPLSRATAVATLQLLALAGWLAASEPMPVRTGLLVRQSGCIETVAIVSLSDTHSRWRSPDGLLKVGADDLRSWGRCPPESIGPCLHLQDGSVLTGAIAAWTDSEVSIHSPLLDRVTLPVATVRSWQRTAATASFTRPPHPQQQIQIQLTNGDSLTAKAVTLSADSAVAEVWHESAGEVGGASATTVVIPRRRLQAIIRPAAPREQVRDAYQAAAAIVGLQDGSRIAVESLQAGGEPTLRNQPAGENVLLKPVALRGQPRPFFSCPRDAITGLLATARPVMPLQWMEPRVVEQRTGLGLIWPLTAGTTVTGLPLTARGLPAFTGLGMHAQARVTYQLPAGTAAVRLVAAVVVDDSAGQAGSVVIRVRAGGGPHSAREVFSSGTLRGGEPPLEIDMPLDQARWLELEVDPTDDGDALDRVLWLEPRLITRQTSQNGRHAPSPAA